MFSDYYVPAGRCAVVPLNFAMLSALVQTLGELKELFTGSGVPIHAQHDGVVGPGSVDIHGNTHPGTPLDPVNHDRRSVVPHPAGGPPDLTDTGFQRDLMGVGHILSFFFQFRQKSP